MPRRPATLLALTLVASAAASPLAGCGNSRTPAPEVGTPVLGPGVRFASYPLGGVSLSVPLRWAAQPGQAPPLVATVSSGRATVAIWRYPRSQPLPATATALQAALPALLSAVRLRDPSFRLQGARALSVAGHPALQVVGVENIAGAIRRVRSEHIYAFGAEVVFDAYAPLRSFSRVNREAFVPMIHTLRLRRPA